MGESPAQQALRPMPPRDLQRGLASVPWQPSVHKPQIESSCVGLHLSFLWDGWRAFWHAMLGGLWHPHFRHCYGDSLACTDIFVDRGQLVLDRRGPEYLAP